ncbi:ABC transporter ATP-binding protein [Miniphocaeibacter halophilus]|uniref:ATP-binding cassette domain-containing protein n=1 Tax=Miniphocaeibacter halophilus TaxID=2931922 RepID=A0AC61MSN5_9FIRM|nr:ATP-binding cassette domain-containing protein [Miniphocaeibacter halophilus]QQK07211.1 ATP-binding cassette domain-containing protein [Miniphocaeibacter halophilus]
MLKIKNLYKSFNIGTDFENNLFRDFNIAFEDNTATTIIGSNGCGKSTLMNLIAGSLEADAGIIEIDGEDISKYKEEKRSKYIGRVHQNPSMGVSPSLTILENMALADKKNEKFTLRKLIKKDRIEYYKEQLKTLDLGLENKLDSRVDLLSGGQRQSLSLLMASMKHPKILLLDEHTAALDPKTSRVVMNKTIDLIKNKKLTTVMITHDMRDAVEYSDRVIMLERGKIVLDKKSSEITEQELYKIYQDKIIEMETRTE